MISLTESNDSHEMNKMLIPLMALLFQVAALHSASAGTWRDHFFRSTLGPEWTGNRSEFQIRNSRLEGVSALPVGASPLNIVEIATDSSECVVACWINIVAPNLRVCTKGALILRHSSLDGYVFALHEPTQTIEVYRLSNGEMLIEKPALIRFETWYHLRAELSGATMRFYVDGKLIGTVVDEASFSGGVGVAVQDAEPVLFDDFSVTGANVQGNADDVLLPEMRIIPPEAGEVAFRFEAEAGYDYFVQATSEPWSNDWQAITNFTAKLQSFEATVLDQTTNSFRLYRVEKVPCDCR